MYTVHRVLLLVLVLLTSSGLASAKGQPVFVEGTNVYVGGSVLKQAKVAPGAKVRFIGGAPVCKRGEAPLALKAGLLEVGQDKKAISCTQAAAVLTISIDAKALKELRIGVSDRFIAIDKSPVSRLALTVGDELIVQPPNGECKHAGTPPLSATKGMKFSDAFQYTCTLGAATLTLNVSEAPVDTPATTTPVPQQNAAPAITKCSDGDLAITKAPSYCGQNQADVVTVCVGLNGEFVGDVPELAQGQHAKVQLLAPTGSISATLATSFERQVFLNTIQADKDKLDDKSGDEVQKLVSRTIALTSAGKLQITVQRIGGEVQGVAKGDEPAKKCSVAEGTKTNELPVIGDYYLAVGLAGVYHYNKGLTVETSTGGDGISRVETDHESGLDLLANLVVYPWGVRPTTKFMPGFIVGTSLLNPGRSWQLGVELAVPVAGAGLVGGVSANAVDVPKDSYQEGRPLPADEDVPTKTGAQFGLFVGFNLDDTLFRKIFAPAVPGS